MPDQSQARSSTSQRIFLCHSSEDKPSVRNLYRRLISDGFNPWLDEQDILPGQDWDREIAVAVKSSAVVLVCLSCTAGNKTGYIQKEIKYALDVAAEQPDGTIFMIPVRLEECDVPDRLKQWQWVNIFDEHGYSRLIQSLRVKGLVPVDVGGTKLADVRQWDHRMTIPSLTSVRELRTLTGHTGYVLAVTLTPDGKEAISASGDRTLKMWEVASGRDLRTLEGHASSVYSAAVTPDGRRAVSASGDATLKLWEVSNGRELQTLVGHTNAVTAVAVTPDGKRAVSASVDRTLKVWELSSGRDLRTLTGHTRSVRAVAITPDGKRAVSASYDRMLKVWDLESGRELRNLSGHTRFVYAVAVTPDGKRAVSASRDRTLRVWDLGSGRQQHTLTGHTDRVLGVAVTPDGQRAVSVSSDRTLKAWGLLGGRELVSFIADAELWCCAILPDGRTILAGDCNGAIHVLCLE